MRCVKELDYLAPKLAAQIDHKQYLRLFLGHIFSTGIKETIAHYCCSIDSGSTSVLAHLRSRENRPTLCNLGAWASRSRFSLFSANENNNISITNAIGRSNLCGTLSRIKLSARRFTRSQLEATCCWGPIDGLRCEPIGRTTCTRTIQVYKSSCS